MIRRASPAESYLGFIHLCVLLYKVFLMITCIFMLLCSFKSRMSHTNLQRIREIRQQLVAETGSFGTDWVLVQKLLDELMVKHQQYKQFAINKNIHLYN